MQIISCFEVEFCYWTMLFVLVTCLSNFKTTFWIWHRITGTNLYSLWQLFKICGGKKISVWLSKTFTENYWQVTKYVKVTILACRRLSGLWWNTCGKLKNKKVAAQMCLGQEAVWRLRLNKSIVTSTMLFKPRFCFIFCFFSSYRSNVYSTIRFCYGIKYSIIS